MKIVPCPVRPHVRHAFGVLALVALIASFVACDATVVPSPAPSGETVARASDIVPPDSLPPADPVSVAAVSAAISAVTLGEPASIDALDALRFDDGAAEAAARALADGVTGDARWAAAWVYASAGDDPAVLRPLLVDEDESVRATAAVTLLAAGSTEAIPVLVELTDSEDQLTGSVPPVTIGRWTAGTLATSLDATMDAPGASAADTGKAWSAWLQLHDGTFTFDAESGTWSTK